MITKFSLLCLVLLVGFQHSVSFGADDPQAGSAPSGRPPVTRARYFPVPGEERAMLGGKFSGSNVSERSGYEVLAQITAVPPAGKWSEISWPGGKYYRWLRYEAPPGSYGNVAEIEFYSGQQKVGLGSFGSLECNPKALAFFRAMDGRTDTFFKSSVADGQVVGTDVGYWNDPAPEMTPLPGEKTGPVQVTLTSNPPNTTIRYSFEGTPGPDEGTLYTGPISIDHRTTLFAVAYRKGFAPSPTAWGTYLGSDAAKPGLSTFHIGNSLTGMSTVDFAKCALSAGWQHDYRCFWLGGASSAVIWDKCGAHPDAPKPNDTLTWNQELSSLTKVDDFTVRSRMSI